MHKKSGPVNTTGALLVNSAAGFCRFYETGSVLWLKHRLMKRDKDLVILGQNLRYYRKRAKLSQVYVAKAVNMDRQNYWRVECGRQNIGYQNLCKICRVINADVRIVGLPMAKKGKWRRK